jgi:hypothetical protein
VFATYSLVTQAPKIDQAHLHSEYERRAEDAIEVFQQLATQRQLTTQEIRQYNCYHTTYGHTPAPPSAVTTPTIRPPGGGPAAPAHTPIEVLTHPAGPDLLRYAVDGCPVDCGEQWTQQRIEAAIAKGAHASAEAPGAADACRKEALKRVADSSCRLVT